MFRQSQPGCRSNAVLAVERDGWLHAYAVGRDGKDESAWETTMTVPMRFNRLLLLRPWLWHTAGPGFGDSRENGRLVYLMFFAAA